MVIGVQLTIKSEDGQPGSVQDYILPLHSKFIIFNQHVSFTSLDVRQFLSKRKTNVTVILFSSKPYKSKEKIMCYKI